MWWQSAAVTARRQFRPPESTWLLGIKRHLAHLSNASELKPLKVVVPTLIGCPAWFEGTAATMGILSSATAAEALIALGPYVIY